MMAPLKSLAAWLLVVSLFSVARAQVFPPDAPILVDPDRLDMPAPQPHSIGDYYDFFLNTFGSPGEYDGPALNTNSLGDVPNSSWYTRRHYWHPMTIDELVRGPNRLDGPAEGEWRVVDGKSEGKAPGMQIEDERGDRYLLKFDPPGHPEMSSGAEVIATKFYHALGYNVPENYLVRFGRARLSPGEDATIDVPGRGTVPLTDAIIDTLLARVPRYDDGSYRAVASKFLEGEPLGPFLYWGTRPDDANDIFPHEGRRELRGLRVAASWLNHTDARSANSLDMLVKEEGRQFVRHHLIDFGSTLGAGALAPKRRWAGFEYIIAGAPIAVRALTLGVLGLDWAGIEYPEEPAVGHIDAEHFDPEAWRTQYPNPAFIRMDDADAFWAASQVMHFKPEEIAAIVEAGEYSNPDVTAYITDVLLERRRKIGETYLRFGGGIDRVAVDGNTLRFDDLIATYDLGRPPQRHVVWRTFDNVSGERGPELKAAEVNGTTVTIPPSDSRFLEAEIRTPGLGITRVFLRDGEVVGLKRE